jgi:hypothetical protein
MDYTLPLQLIKHSGIHRSTTSAVDSANGRTVDIAGKGIGVASNQGDTEGEGGRTDVAQVEGEGKGESRQQGEGGGMTGEVEEGESGDHCSPGYRQPAGVVRGRLLFLCLFFYFLYLIDFVNKRIVDDFLSHEG